MVGLTYTPPLLPSLATTPAATGTAAPLTEILSALAATPVGDSLTETLNAAAGPGNVVTGTVTSASPGGSFTLVTGSGAEISLHHPPELPLDPGSVVTIRIVTTGLTPQAMLLAVDGRPIVLRTGSGGGQSGGSSASQGRPAGSAPRAAGFVGGPRSASAYADSLAAVLSLEDEAAIDAAIDPPDVSAEQADTDPTEPDPVTEAMIAVLARPAPAKPGLPPLPVGTRYFLSPSGDASAAPAGFVVQSAVLVGRVVPPRRAGETLVETVIGTLALPMADSPAPGTAVRLKIAAVAPPLPETEPVETEGAAPPPTQSLMEEVLGLLATHAPPLAEQVRAALILPTGEGFLRAVFQLLGDRERRSRLRDTAGETGRALLDAGRPDLAGRFAAASAELGEEEPRQTVDGWLITTLPFFGLAGEAPMRIYARPPDPDEQKETAEPRSRGERVVVEVTLRRLGALQFDGLVRDRRFDLVLRTSQPLDPALDSVIEGAFHQALAECGWAGGIVFGRRIRLPDVPPAAGGSDAVEIRI